MFPLKPFPVSPTYSSSGARFRLLKEHADTVGPPCGIDDGEGRLTLTVWQPTDGPFVAIGLEDLPVTEPAEWRPAVLQFDDQRHGSAVCHGVELDLGPVGRIADAGGLARGQTRPHSRVATA